MSSKPIYLAVPPGPAREALVAAFGGAAEILDPPLRSLLLRERAPGIVLLDASGLTATELLEAATSLAGPDWVLAVVDGGDPVTVRTVSSGHPCGLEVVAERSAGADDGDQGLLELHGVLAEIARARHDINNPLTSALAETQMLLLDVPEGDVRDGLETVQTQLRRIRDLVARTRHLRPGG